jgi:hypothetical protein
VPVPVGFLRLGRLTADRPGIGERFSAVLN